MYRSGIESGMNATEAGAQAQQYMSSVAQQKLSSNLNPSYQPTASQVLRLQNHFQNQWADATARNNQYLDAALAVNQNVARDAGPYSGLLQSQALDLRSNIENNNAAMMNHTLLAPYYNQQTMVGGVPQMGSSQITGANQLDPNAMMALAQQKAQQQSLAGIGG
jgi:hypothetical protein